MRNNKKSIRERFTGSKDEDLAYALDDLCRKHAEVGFADFIFVPFE